MAVVLMPRCSIDAGKAVVRIVACSSDNRECCAPIYSAHIRNKTKLFGIVMLINAIPIDPQVRKSQLDREPKRVLYGLRQTARQLLRIVLVDVERSVSPYITQADIWRPGDNFAQLS